MMYEPITIPALEEKAGQPPADRAPWSDRDSEIVGRYYRIGAVTCDDIRAVLDNPNRTDNAIGIEAGRWRRAQGADC